MPSRYNSAETQNDSQQMAKQLGLNFYNLPIDQIAKIIINDPNPEQRMEAIVVLASHDEEAAHAILQNALNDSDPEVVELAKSILQDVDLDYESDDVE